MPKILHKHLIVQAHTTPLGHSIRYKQGNTKLYILQYNLIYSHESNTVVGEIAS